MVDRAEDIHDKAKQDETTQDKAKNEVFLFTQSYKQPLFSCCKKKKKKDPTMTATLATTTTTPHQKPHGKKDMTMEDSGSDTSHTQLTGYDYDYDHEDDDEDYYYYYAADYDDDDDFES